MRVGHQLGGGDAQVVGEAVVRRRAQVVLALLSRHLASSFDEPGHEKVNTGDGSGVRTSAGCKQTDTEPPECLSARRRL